MRTWLDKKTGLWVSQRTESVWTGLVDINTGEKIFEGDRVSVEQYDYSSRKTIRKIWFLSGMNILGVLYLSLNCFKKLINL